MKGNGEGFKSRAPDVTQAGEEDPPMLADEPPLLGEPALVGEVTLLSEAAVEDEAVPGVDGPPCCCCGA